MSRQVKSYRFDVKKESNFHEIIRLGRDICLYPNQINARSLKKLKDNIKQNVDYFDIPPEVYNNICVENMPVFEEKYNIHLRIFNRQVDNALSDKR